ncbi:hypothetical protein Scep_003934 [Stephania cephalantha]|uniref:Uncharacterized protein n=1 Tax=Stephania cephalantha TaxID=152367 RepID=A0AAP0PW79_9MAGN
MYMASLSQSLLARGFIYIYLGGVGLLALPPPQPQSLLAWAGERGYRPRSGLWMSHSRKGYGGRSGTHPKPESAGLLPRLNDLLDVAPTYIDGRRQMVCSLLGGLGGAHLSRRSPLVAEKLVAEEPKFPTE